MPLKPISVVLLLSMLLANFSGLWVFLGFEVNQRYIVRELCENRDKPELHCNGKCYLMKKLKQAQEKEQKQERQSQKSQVQDAITGYVIVFRQYAFAEIDLHVPFSTGMPCSIRNSIFHPPQQV
ncbi:hypothetical protein [Pedobacter sp. JY14-1]|uniref:hypothetical protein n=1 Tax=Pedobacter sp. JY14-1 TaxID=3034151 RepID=UPI0023E2AB35|nr:hypothetical protein [Pedobacter sp. JY14-1]